MEEAGLVNSTIEYFTGIPASVVGLLFGAGSYIRGKIKKRREDRQEKWLRDMEREVKRQLDFIYSLAYKAMESRVFYISSKGETTIEVRNEKDTEKVPLGAFRSGYKDAIKEVAFKTVLPCIMGKLEDDKKLYKKDDKDKYIVDTGEDIRQTFIGTLGRKIGISQISTDVEEDTLNKKLFIEMYGKIIRRATGKY